MSELHIGTGWSGRVYAGHTRKDKDGHEIWTSKTDCTSDFYSTLITLFAGKQAYIGSEDNPHEYTLTLKKNTFDTDKEQTK